MDTAQWPQEILMKPMEEIIPNTCSSSLTAATAATTTTTTTTCSNLISNTTTTNNSNSKPPSTSLERKVRPQKDQAVNCPRCNSTNTKFCYYNNYSLTQPRFFCKTCRRYWTEGGSLRNIPVGGGSRKNKRPSSSSYSSSSSKKISSHDLVAAAAVHESNYPHHQNPKIHPHQMHQHHHQHYQGQDLNLGFPHQTHHHHHQQQQHQQQEFRSLSEFMQLPTIDQTSNTPKNQITNSGGAGAGAGGTATTTTTTTTANDGHHHLSALELLNGLTSSRGLTPFMPMPVPDPNGVYSSGFSLQDFKPSLNFSLVDGLGNGYGSLQGDQVHHQTTASETNNNGRLLFPFEDLKQVSSTTSADHNNSTENNNHDQNGEQEDSTPGYWSGMLGNGGSW